MGAQGVFQGFSFCGRHSREFGVWYIPGGSILNPQIPAFDITTLEIPSRDGGYFFGSKVRPRVFTLPCYIEEPPEAWPRIQAWQRRERFGPLEFDDRPGMVFMARPAEAIEPKAYIRKAFEETTVTGTFTVHLIAHDPFAKMGKLSITDLAELEANSGFLRYHTGLLPADIMPPLDHSGTIGKTKELLLYNPGSERTPLTIEAAGDVGDDGLLLVNRTTGQRCRIVKLTKQATTQAGAVLSLDGEHGRTVLVHSGVATPAYAYHDEGYIALEGASPIDRDLVFRYVGGSRRATCDQSLHADVVGRYVHLHAGWRHITSLVNDHTIGVDFTFQHSGTETSAVVCMNEMVLTTASGLTLDTLRFSYVPRYA